VGGRDVADVAERIEVLRQVRQLVLRENLLDLDHAPQAGPAAPAARCATVVLWITADGRDRLTIAMPEVEQETGRKGVARVKRLLEASMRFDLPYDAYQHQARVTPRSQE
jgi:hypothetical protein